MSSKDYKKLKTTKIESKTTLSPRVANLRACVKDFPKSADYKKILAEELLKRYESRL